MKAYGLFLQFLSLFVNAIKGSVDKKIAAFILQPVRFILARFVKYVEQGFLVYLFLFRLMWY